ncbi:hypothetical protein HAX54_040565, partial [Datura stramonium]|nr:hypothetical protein [Datura stramonium]
RGFLATAGAIIRVKSKNISMIVDGWKDMFDIFKVARLPPHYEELNDITVVVPEMFE